MRFIPLLVMALVLGACQRSSHLSRSQADTELVFKESFYSNSEKWAQYIEGQGYEYSYTQRCFCLTEVRVYKVAVNHLGEITKASYTDSGGQEFEITSDKYSELLTILDLFAFVELKIAGEIDDVRVEYNSEYGYPQKLNVDYNFRMIDDEVSYQVESVTLLKK